VNEKKVTIITIACLAFILLAGGGAIYYFQFVWLDELQVQLKAVTDERDKTKAKVEMIEPLKKEIAKLKIDVKDRDGKIPALDRAEYDRFANLLDDMRRRSGVTVSRGAWVNPTKPSPVAGSSRPARVIPGTVHKVQYDLAVSGGFYQLLRYLNLVEQHTRFINVQDLTISKSSSSDSSPAAALRREMKLTLYSYTYRPGTEIPELPLIEEQRKGKSTDIPD
jgi:Tfp pilus assembly protein PilO